MKLDLDDIILGSVADERVILFLAISSSDNLQLGMNKSIAAVNTSTLSGKMLIRR